MKPKQTAKKKVVQTSSKKTPKKKLKEVVQEVKEIQEIPKSEKFARPAHELTKDEFHQHLAGAGNLEQTMVLRVQVQRTFSHTARVHEAYWGSRDFRPFHKVFVEEALKNGKQVDEHVLLDYVDLEVKQ